MDLVKHNDYLLRYKIVLHEEVIPLLPQSATFLLTVYPDCITWERDNEQWPPSKKKDFRMPITTTAPYEIWDLHDRAVAATKAAGFDMYDNLVWWRVEANDMIVALNFEARCFYYCCKTINKEGRIDLTNEEINDMTPDMMLYRSIEIIHAYSEMS